MESSHFSELSIDDLAKLGASSVLHSKDSHRYQRSNQWLRERDRVQFS